jgi:hypothetical protein
MQDLLAQCAFPRLQEYIDQHSLQKVVEDVLNGCVKTKPEEPLSFMVREAPSPDLVLLIRGSIIRMPASVEAADEPLKTHVYRHWCRRHAAGSTASASMSEIPLELSLLSSAESQGAARCQEQQQAVHHSYCTSRQFLL